MLVLLYNKQHKEDSFRFYSKIDQDGWGPWSFLKFSKVLHSCLLSQIQNIRIYLKEDFACPCQNVLFR